MKGKEADTSYS